MNISSWVLWGFASTIVLTTILSVSQALGVTRMNLPFLLGTIFTPNRDKAKLLGFAAHLINGWLFSILYIAAFHSYQKSIWIGAVIGLVHSLFVLFVGMPFMPALHPRMASETQPPTRLRQLEPPGMMALHYGARTPISIILAHIVFGSMLGFFYAYS